MGFTLQCRIHSVHTRIVVIDLNFLPQFTGAKLDAGVEGDGFSRCTQDCLEAYIVTEVLNSVCFDITDLTCNYTDIHRCGWRRGRKTPPPSTTEAHLAGDWGAGIQLVDGVSEGEE